MSIKFLNISKNFGKKETLVKALKNINFEIEEGEMVCILGPSGSGKSTLLNIIGLIDRPTKGEYYLNNKNISNFDDKELSRLRNERFGFVMQDYVVINDYTVTENIEIPINYSRINKTIKKKKIREILKKLEILDKIKTKGRDLSGGQSQRVAIARAIINNPNILLADEPTGALDRKTGEKVINIFKEINKTKKTIIIVTHNEEIAKNCRRIIRIDDGKIIENKVLKASN